MITFEVPNLDDTSDTELRDVAIVFDALAHYAATGRRAMQHRLSGCIDTALAYERACEVLYASLPEWARW